MPHLTSASAFAPSRTTILNFEVPRGCKIAEVTVEILGFAVSKMGQSDLLDILVGGVGDIN